MSETNIKKQIIKISIILGILLLVVGVSYAIINLVLEGTRRQVITATDVLVVLEEGESITVENALPMYDEVGKIQADYFSFDIVSKVDRDINYKLRLVDITDANSEKLNYEDVKYYLTKEDIEKEPKLLSEMGEFIDEGTVGANETISHTLRFWIRDGVTDNEAIVGKTLKFRLEVEITTDVRGRYDIVYETGIDGVTIETGTKIEGENYVISNTVLEKEGYVFLGWSTVEGSEVAEYESGDIYSVEENATLYAVFAQEKYLVQFNANGGSSAPESQEKIYGQDLEITTTLPVRSGYTFQGWSTSASGTVEYAAGDIYQDNAHLTLYAIWKINRLNILYGGKYSTNPSINYHTVTTTNATSRAYFNSSDGKIYLNGRYDTPNVAGMYTSLINFTPYTTLYIKMSCDKVVDGNTGYIGLNDSSSLGYNVKKLLIMKELSMQTLKYDVSAINRNASIVITVNGGMTLDSNAVIEQIYLE